MSKIFKVRTEGALCSYFSTVCSAISIGADIRALWIRLHLQFTINFFTIFIVSSTVKDYREAYPAEVRSIETGDQNPCRH
jgi:hypothetical protein